MNSFVSELQQQFSELANSSAAPAMEAYMKHHFSYLGINSPRRKSVSQPWISKINKSCTRAEKWQIIFELWNLKEREYHYTAVELLNKFKKKEWEIQEIEQLKALITTHSWWDSVDAIASNALGDYLKLYAEHQHEIVDEWINSKYLWQQRSCLIFQLKYKNEVDFELLKFTILRLKHDTEFFIQKAIGWSLREYSKVNPEAVKAFLKTNTFTTLATREASKYLN